MTDDGFKVVTDDYRKDRFGPLVRALIDGRTVLVPSDTAKISSTFQTLRRHGYKMKQRRREDGIVLWAEKVEA